MNALKRAIRILMVEDDEDDFIITRDLLREAGDSEFLLDWEPDSAKAQEAIRRQEHDLYIIDYRLGEQTGLELIETSIKSGVIRPFVLLTGLGDETLDRNAIELGAADYLVKGRFDGQLLSRSIRYAIDRQQARQRLVDSEARHRLLFDANPEAMWVFALADLRILTANAAATRFLGYTREELLAMTPLDLRDEEELARYKVHHENRVAQQVHTQAVGIWRYRHKDGHSVYADVIVHDIDYEGQAASMVVAIDMTEKLATRRALERQEQVFRNVLSDSRDILVVVNDFGQLCYVNRVAELLFASSPDQLEGLLQAFPKSEDRVREWSLVTDDGRTVDFEVHQSGTEWGGQPARLLSLRDITDRKDSQRELRLLKRSLDYSYNGVVIADARNPELPIIYVNPAFERITGYKENEVIGRNCRFLQQGERDALALEEIRQGIQQKRDVHVVLKNFRKDGSEFWNDLYISPVLDESGEVTHFVGFQNDVSEQKRYELELSYNASHDRLTGLPNRAVFEDRLRQGCQISQRYDRHLAVVFIDLDRFKPINDSYGHLVGDKLLIEVARRIQQDVRPGDTVTRLGGDEFIVLLPDLAREDDVVPVVERLMNSLALPYKVDELDLHVTPSIGIALSEGTLLEPLNLIQQADLAMYRAKEEGRNNYQWYTSDLNKRVVERLSLRNELQKALDQKHFELHYQPQVDARSGRVVGLEALVRWRHPVRGLIPPVEFISVAEDAGLMIPLGQWILETACAHVSELAQQGLRGLTMAVNISPLQFQRSNFVNSVHAVVDRYQLLPGMLEIELTESVLIENTEQAVDCLQDIKQLGVRISLDDFGTGYSSLSYLKRLPIDKVKIDRSFVREVISNQHDAAITQAIIAMAHHLKLRVIAEGVETEPQIAFLMKNHCDELQGFYFAKPMPFGEIQTFLRDRLSVELPVPSANQGAPRTLLLLDDEENILRALNRVLRRDGYQILMATRPQDAFELLAKNDVQVIISDQRMPEMSGTEFFSRVKNLYPSTVRIVLSGYTDLKSVTEAVNQGAIYKFLTKPWDDEQLRKEIAQVFIHALNLRGGDQT